MLQDRPTHVNTTTMPTRHSKEGIRLRGTQASADGYPLTLQVRSQSAKDSLPVAGRDSRASGNLLFLARRRSDRNCFETTGCQVLDETGF
jgi:hypothetical protein